MNRASPAPPVPHTNAETAENSELGPETGTATDRTRRPNRSTEHQQTGDARLRARLPAGWRVGDKTGSGERGSTNDVGILWPPDAAPLIVAVYLTQTAASMNERNEALAAVGEAVAAAFRGHS